jgi:hypothetical protein
MRMILPTQRERHGVDRSLRAFFTGHRPSEFRRAIAAICRFYALRMPRVEWYEYLDWGKGAGRTWEDGTIGLVHPENWKRGRKYNSMRQWIETVHHEMGHYLFWTDAERKADLFAAAMMEGVRHPAIRRALAGPQLRLAGTQRSLARARSATRLRRAPRRARRKARSVR